MAKTWAFAASAVLEQVHARLLDMMRFPREYDLIADERGKSGRNHAGSTVGGASDRGDGRQRHDEGE